MSNDAVAGDPIRFRDWPREGDEAAVRRMAEATGFFRDDEVEVACELVRERLERGPASGYEFVFADGAGGEPLGYACFGPIPCTVGSFDLYWIVVDPGVQRRGLGGVLLAGAEQAARRAGGRRMYIETSSLSKYEPTRRFYERAGYTLEARMVDFYQPGDDKMIYGKVLVGGGAAGGVVPV
jgi:GNAT superfamily N-acetyltransferase